MKKLIFLLLATLCFDSFAQQTNQAKIEELTEKNWQNGLSLLTDIVSMPNDAFYPEQIEVNLAWCENQFAKRGYTVERLETAGIPLMLVEKKQAGATKQPFFIFM